MKVTARNHVAVIEHQRIVRGCIGFDDQHARGMAEIVQAGAHDLRHAADGIGVLHAPAIGVRGVDGAAVQQRAHGSRHGDLSLLAACRVDARIEGLDGALYGFQRQAAGHQACGQHAFGLEQAGQRQRGGDLGSIEQCQPFLGAEHKGLQADMLHGLTAGNELAAHLGLPLADQHASQVRQRRQIARSPYRPLGGNHGQDIGIGQGQQRVHQRRAGSRMPTGQTHGLGGQNQAHHMIRQRLARADTVRKHQIALQLGQTLMGDLGRSQLAETGVDAVDHLVFIDDVLHMRLGLAHGRIGGLRHAELHAAVLNAAQLSQRELAGMQFQFGVRELLGGGSVHGYTCLYSQEKQKRTEGFKGLAGISRRALNRFGNGYRVGSACPDARNAPR